MDKLVNVFTGIKATALKRDEDIVDRLSSKYTVAVIVVFSMFVGMTSYMGKPITCWVPKHFTGSHTKYTNAYCWVKNTYYLPFDVEIPKAHEEERRQMIPYYQWIPFILLGQALLFHLPSAIWHGLNQQAGVDADNILASAQVFDKVDKLKDKDHTLAYIVNQINRFLGTRKALRISQFKHFKENAAAGLCSTRR